LAESYLRGIFQTQDVSQLDEVERERLLDLKKRGVSIKSGGIGPEGHVYRLNIKNIKDKMPESFNFPHLSALHINGNNLKTCESLKNHELIRSLSIHRCNFCTKEALKSYPKAFLDILNKKAS